MFFLFHFFFFTVLSSIVCLFVRSHVCVCSVNGNTAARRFVKPSNKYRTIVTCVYVYTSAHMHTCTQKADLYGKMSVFLFECAVRTVAIHCGSSNKCDLLCVFTGTIRVSMLTYIGCNVHTCACLNHRYACQKCTHKHGCINISETEVFV